MHIPKYEIKSPFSTPISYVKLATFLFSLAKIWLYSLPHRPAILPFEHVYPHPQSHPYRGIAASEEAKSHFFSKTSRKVADFTYEIGVENGDLTSYFGKCTYQNT